MKKWISENWISVLTFTGMALAGVGGLISREAEKRTLEQSVTNEVTRQLQAIIDYSEE